MKTVIVTGASRGIGKEIARKFAKEKYNVVVCYNKSKKEAEKLVEELSPITNVIAFKVDVSKENEVEQLINSTIKIYGSVDVLVNNAGVDLIKLLIDSTTDDYNFIMDTNMRGIFNTCKLASKNMISNQYGKIINISSIWGDRGGSMESIYSASKGAVIAFTKALSKELGPNGITVNAVSPGFIDTDMNRDISDEIKKEIVEGTSLGRVGTPEDVANIVVFLASEQANFITGQVIGVDGGSSL